MAFAIRAIDPHENVYIYESASLSESISHLTQETIIPFMLYLMMKFGGMTPDFMRSTYRDLNFIFVPQPLNERKESTYDIMDVYIFCYLITSIPRNHTNKFMTYQGNKAEGILRQAGVMAVPMTKEDLIVRAEVLTCACVFFNRHDRLLSKGFQILLAIGTSKDAFAGTEYAGQVLGAARYSNMIGIKIIEETLVERESDLLMDKMINSYMKKYNRFKKEAKSLYGRNWVFTAILNKPLWSEYSRNDHFKELWIHASIIAFLNDDSYGTMTVKKHDIAHYAIQPRYINRIKPYNRKDHIQVETKGSSKDTLSRVQKVIESYTKAHNDSDNDDG